MHKRGQVALFIVLGIVIIIVIALGLVFRSQISELVTEKELAKGEAAKVLETELRAFSSDCLRKVSIEGLQRVLASGGYYGNARETLDYDTFDVPYYLYLKKEYAPQKEDLAVNLARYIEANLNDCFLSYPKEIKVKKPEIEIVYGEKLLVNAEHKITLPFNDAEVRIKNYNTEVGVNLGEIYADAIGFYGGVKNVSDTDFISQGLVALHQEHQFYSEFVDEREVVFILTFPKALEEEKDLDYYFAMKYPLVEQPEVNEINELFTLSFFGFGEEEAVEESTEEPDGEISEEMEAAILEDVEAELELPFEEEQIEWEEDQEEPEEEVLVK